MKRIRLASENRMNPRPLALTLISDPINILSEILINLTLTESHYYRTTLFRCTPNHLSPTLHCTTSPQQPRKFRTEDRAHRKKSENGSNKSQTNHSRHPIMFSRNHYLIISAVPRNTVFQIQPSLLQMGPTLPRQILTTAESTTVPIRNQVLFATARPLQLLRAPKFSTAVPHQHRELGGPGAPWAHLLLLRQWGRNRLVRRKHRLRLGNRSSFRCHGRFSRGKEISLLMLSSLLEIFRGVS